MYVFFLNHISFFVPKLTDTFLNNHWSWAAGKIPQNTPELTSSPGCLNKKSHYYSMYAIASSRGITIRLNSIMQKKKLWRLVFRCLVQKFRRPKWRSRCWSMILNWSKASSHLDLTKGAMSSEVFLAFSLGQLVRQWKTISIDQKVKC